MTPRTQRVPDPNAAAQLVLVSCLIGGLLGVALIWARYPGMVAVWAGLLVAAFLSIAPAFTGPKGANGDPTPVGAEQDLMLRHQMWSWLRGALWFPTALWPGKRFSIAPIVAILIAGAVWLLPAGGAGFVWEQAQLTVDPISGSEELLLRGVNAWFALVVAAQLPAAIDRFASRFEPRPQVTVADVVSVVRQNPRAAIPVLVGAVAAAVAVFLGVSTLARVPQVRDWFPLPDMTAMLLAVAVALLVLVAWQRPRVVAAWEKRVAAAEKWEQVWEERSLKLSPPPRLVDHAEYLDGALTVATFVAPPGVGSTGMMEARKSSPTEILQRVFGGQVEVAILDEPDVDGDGRPLPDSRSATRFRVAVIEKEAKPDPCDPSVPEDVMKIAFEIAAAQILAAEKKAPPMWVRTVSAVTSPPTEPAAAPDTDDDRCSSPDVPEVASPEPSDDDEHEGEGEDTDFVIDDVDAAQAAMMRALGRTPRSGTGGAAQPRRSARERRKAARLARRERHEQRRLEIERQYALSGNDPLMERPSATPQEKPASYTQAWAARVVNVNETPDAVGSIVTLLPFMFAGDPDKIEAYADGSTIYFGAVTADTTPLADEGLRQRLDDLAEVALWHQRWGDSVVAAGIAAGAKPYDAQIAMRRDYQLDMRPPDERNLMGRSASPFYYPVLRTLPFLMMQGVNLGDYMRPRTEDCLRSAVRGAPFLHIGGWPIMSQREGDRRVDGFILAWAESPVPTNPASIPGELTVERSEQIPAARVLFNGLFSQAFDQARLARPEVIHAEPLTDASSRQSIWRVKVRLYGGVSFDMVRKSLMKLQSSFGCEWLEVAQTSITADIVEFAVGAHPEASSVSFSGMRADRNRAWCRELMWSQAFAATGLLTPAGVAPKLVSTGPLEANPNITETRFAVPAGKTLQDFVLATDKLMTALGVGFLEARPGKSTNEVLVLSAAEDPMPYPAPVDWRAMKNPITPLQMPFGSTVEGSTYWFDLDFDPHLLVVGGTGTGKSVVLSMFLEAFLLRGFECFIADPVKGGADFSFAKPWLRAATGDLLETREMFEWLSAEKDRRKALNVAHGVGKYLELPPELRPSPIAVFVDEFTSLLLPDEVDKPDSEASPEELQEYERERERQAAKRKIGTRVGQLAREARSVGIHLVLATQKLTANTLSKAVPGGDLKDQLARYALGDMSYGSRASALRSPEDAKHLKVPGGTKGRGVFESSSAEPTQLVQSWWAEDRDAGLSHQDALAQALQERLGAEGRDDVVDLAALVEAKQRDTTVFGEELDAAVGVGADDDQVMDLGVVSVEFDFGSLDEPEPSGPSFQVGVDDDREVGLGSAGSDCPGLPEPAAPEVSVAVSGEAGSGVHPSAGDLASVVGERFPWELPEEGGETSHAAPVQENAPQLPEPGDGGGGLFSGRTIPRPAGMIDHF